MLIVSINLIKVGEDGSVINDDLHVHFTYTVRFDAMGITRLRRASMPTATSFGGLGG